uniref:lysozyme C, milk isozyme-like n=1 Tax=Jaculus jaculus TaxID=51337 RepID=UPI001E1B3A8A|nr:lysozyme C, milk isozyme-like [Jaculus jaculus]
MILGFTSFSEVHTYWTLLGILPGATKNFLAQLPILTYSETPLCLKGIRDSTVLDGQSQSPLTAEMRFILILSLLSCFLAAYKARVLTTCELAHELKAQGMDGFHGYSLADWVCLAEHASNLNTQACDGKSADDCSAYGIFQLSNIWCNNNQLPSENDCNTPCSKLLDDDIKDDILCAKIAVKDPERSSTW